MEVTFITRQTDDAAGGVQIVSSIAVNAHTLSRQVGEGSLVTVEAKGCLVLSLVFSCSTVATASVTSGVLEGARITGKAFRQTFHVGGAADRTGIAQGTAEAVGVGSDQAFGAGSCTSGVDEIATGAVLAHFEAFKVTKCTNATVSTLSLSKVGLMFADWAGVALGSGGLVTEGSRQTRRAFLGTNGSRLCTFWTGKTQGFSLVALIIASQTVIALDGAGDVGLCTSRAGSADAEGFDVGVCADRAFVAMGAARNSLELADRALVAGERGSGVGEAAGDTVVAFFLTIAIVGGSLWAWVTQLLTAVALEVTRRTLGAFQGSSHIRVGASQAVKAGFAAREIGVFTASAIKTSCSFVGWLIFTFQTRRTLSLSSDVGEVARITGIADFSALVVDELTDSTRIAQGLVDTGLCITGGAVEARSGASLIDVTTSFTDLTSGSTIVAHVVTQVANFTFCLSVLVLEGARKAVVTVDLACDVGKCAWITGFAVRFTFARHGQTHSTHLTQRLTSSVLGITEGTVRTSDAVGDIGVLSSGAVLTSRESGVIAELTTLTNSTHCAKLLRRVCTNSTIVTSCQTSCIGECAFRTSFTFCLALSVGEAATVTNITQETRLGVGK